MGSACAKAILFGEHAVVYGEPGIAVPLPQLTVTASLSSNGYTNSNNSLHITSPDISLNSAYPELETDHPLRRLIDQLLDEFGNPPLPKKVLTIESSIPSEAGLGSGAAVSIAVIRAFAEEFKVPLSVESVSSLAYEIEKIYHGTPSGIDNNVIAHGKPIFFRKDMPVETIELSYPLPLIVAGTGIKSPTREVVGDIRKNYAIHEAVIHEIGQLTTAARTTLLNGSLEQLADLMNANHRLLQHLTASNKRLDQLIDIALKAGAPAAKLTGAGRGGNLIALYRDEPSRQRIQKALTEAGATVYL